MSEPQPITINIDAGWINRAWACVPKTRADFYALPWKIGGKIKRSFAWCFAHTETWLALATGVVAGAGLSPLLRPHLAAYSVPMVEAENVAPRTVNVDLSGVNRVLNELATRTANLERLAAANQATAIATQGVVNSTAGVVDKVSQTTDIIGPLALKMVGGGISIEPAAAPAPKPKPAPSVKTVKTAPIAPPAPPAPAEPAALSLPDWLKSKF